MDEFFTNLLDLSDGAGSLTVSSVILSCLVTFVLGQAIAWVYMKTHRSVTYSASLAQSLVILALIVALVMQIIGSNIARAFGLFGALALIRFRTPVKDAKDTVYLFLAVAQGIAVGTGNILAAVIGTIAICLVLLYFWKIGFGDRLSHDGLFRLFIPLDGDQESAVREILKRYCGGFRLLHMRETGQDSLMEFAFQIQMIDQRFSSQLVADVERVEGVSNVSLLLQDAEVLP